VLFRSFIFKKWGEKTEVDDLLKMHIGVMPLKSGPWFEGKCGFKLIQYLACGIPAIASPVGVNSQIVRHDKDGFIASNKEEWVRYLKMLINDPDLRNRMGKRGRNHIVEEYSLKSQSTAFLTLFNE
jgi:glycosyltransferase involved in cell wall biosynthesis